MKLNGIQCENYSAAEHFSATLVNTTAEDITNINPQKLKITADDGSIVEEFTAYGKLFSIRHIITEDAFEVEFSKVSGTEKKLTELENYGKSLGEKIDASDTVASIVFTALAQNETLDDVTISEHAEIFPKWDENWTGKRGNIVIDEGYLYRSIHDVGVGQNVKPSENPSMWTPIGNPGEEFPKWSQPLGVHDAYGNEDKVLHNDKKWISIVDNNVWEPGVYGWDEYKEDK